MPSYLFTVTAELGRIDGIGDDTGQEELTLSLVDVADHATQFADRPFRDAYRLSTADLAARWQGWFADAAPNAVLSYQEADDPLPHAIVLTLSNPQYSADQHTLTFSAHHVHREPALSPDAVQQIAASHRRAPDSFSGASLFIDSVTEEGSPEPTVPPSTTPASPTGKPVRVINGCRLEPGTQCPGVQIIGADLSGINVEGANFAGANFGKSNLNGANLQRANFEGGALGSVSLYGTDLRGANLRRVKLGGAKLTFTLTGRTRIEGADLSLAKPWFGGAACLEGSIGQCIRP